MKGWHLLGSETTSMICLNDTTAVVSSRFNLKKDGKLIDNIDFINDDISTPIIAFHGLLDNITAGMEQSVDLWHEIENKGTIDDATKEEVEVGRYYTTKKHIKMDYLIWSFISLKMKAMLYHGFL